MILRVFPRRTNMTPDDDMVAVGGPGLFRPAADEVHISCTFTWDKRIAENLGQDWGQYYDAVRVGGPAYDDSGEVFAPGMYVKTGCIVTSRGCNNNCWFCYVPKREGMIRELPITDGWNVLDSNLLQCSERHIREVFEMLGKQSHRPRFTGGLDAAELKEWHVDLISAVRTERVYFAYDKPEDYEPVVNAVKMMHDAGIRRPRISCYVLIGDPRDTMDCAERRLRSMVEIGVAPFAMLWRDPSGEYDVTWKKMQRVWANPTIVGAKMQKAGW